jgi:hypothetical protein
LLSCSRNEYSGESSWQFSIWSGHLSIRLL